MNIEFISPYSFYLHIGKALNQSISRLPSDSWIVHNDQDTLKPPGFADRVKLLIEKHGTPDRLFTCRTNRMSESNPLNVPGMFHQDSITAHLEKASELWKSHRTKINPTPECPGYCMIFHRSLWEKVGGFPPLTIRFDSWLSERSETYVAEGIYIFHLYRWHQPSPGKKYMHLLRPGYLRDQ